MPWYHLWLSFAIVSLFLYVEFDERQGKGMDERIVEPRCDIRMLTRYWALLLVGCIAIGCSGKEEYTTRYPNGKVREHWYEKAVGPNRVIRDGAYESFYPDGSRQTMGEYSAGDSVGRWQELYLNGGMKYEKSYTDRGKLKGRSILWMPSGDTLVFDTYNGRGELDGRHALFRRENGEIREEGDYRNGKRHGIWRRWHRNGQMEYQREYYQGRAVGTWTEFGVDGQLVSRREFLRDLPAELLAAWGEALLEGVPTGRSAFYQQRERQVDSLASEEREYGELRKTSLGWIVPYQWRSPRFAAIEKRRLDTVLVCRYRPTDTLR